MWTVLIAVMNLTSILLMWISYRRMVKFVKMKLRENLRKEDPNSKVDLEKRLLD